MKPYYLYVTPFFPSPTSWRGAVGSDFVAELKRCQQKWQVEVFVPGRGADYDFQGIRVHRFPIRELPSALFPFLFKSFNQRSFLRKVAACGIRLEDVAVCHGNTAFYSIYPLAIKRHNPNCLTLLHHHDPQSFGLGLGVLKHCVLYNAWQFCRLRKFFERIDCHVFISEIVKKSFLSAPNSSWTNYDNYRLQMRGPSFFCCRSVRIKDCMVLHNGVDRSSFKPPTQSRPATSIFTIGCIGNFIDWKDQATLIRAVSAVNVPSGRSVKVIFVGSGPLLETCKKMAESISESRPELAFEFKTEVRHENLSSFYHSFELFVLPSYFEGFGCVFTEAWACGVPFISAKGQGIEDMLALDEREKWLIEPRDDRRLAELICDYMNAPALQPLACSVYLDEIVPEFVKEIEARLTSRGMNYT